jgi:hypothetical protein
VKIPDQRITPMESRVAVMNGVLQEVHVERTQAWHRRQYL